MSPPHGRGGSPAQPHQWWSDPMSGAPCYGPHPHTRDNERQSLRLLGLWWRHLRMPRDAAYTLSEGQDCHFCRSYCRCREQVSYFRAFWIGGKEEVVFPSQIFGFFQHRFSARAVSEALLCEGPLLGRPPCFQ